MASVDIFIEGINPNNINIIRPKINGIKHFIVKLLVTSNTSPTNTGVRLIIDKAINNILVPLGACYDL
ncbi:MAG: hypothetical protein HC932_02550 [Thermales bacterium]|nr:hypothetical protein [Thermales bacterium]